MKSRHTDNWSLGRGSREHWLEKCAFRYCL